MEDGDQTRGSGPVRSHEPGFEAAKILEVDKGSQGSVEVQEAPEADQGGVGADSGQNGTAAANVVVPLGECRLRSGKKHGGRRGRPWLSG